MLTIRHNLDAHVEIARLKGESPVYCEVRTERGGPRLFVNGQETCSRLEGLW